MHKEWPLPLVSAIIPTRERGERLERAVKSVANQTYPNIEIIIVSDRCECVVQSRIRNEVAFPNLQLLRNVRKPGAAGARNTGFLASKGELVGFLDDDAEWLQEKSEMQVRMFRDSHERVALGMYQDSEVRKRDRTPVRVYLRSYNS